MIAREAFLHSSDAFKVELNLKELLGVVYLAYTEILALVQSYPQEWKFYGA